jgi:virginiamycin A acetyltransferase
MIIISKTAKISQYCDIEDSVKGSKIIIGDNVMIDSFVKIKPVGGPGDIIIGANSFINSGVVMYSGNGISIGEDVLIAANCTLSPINHEYRDKTKKIIEQKFIHSKGGITIEDDVWIGANTTILDGAYICKGSVIGAQSLVREKLDPYTVYAGNPLRAIGRRA